MQMVRSKPALCPERIGDERSESRVLRDLLNEVERRLLPPIDLTRREGLRGCIGVRDVAPDHLVEVGLLAAGRPARWLMTRDVAGIADVDGLFARLPFVLNELERAGAHRLFDLLVGGRGR